jgi:hypothetical protein
MPTIFTDLGEAKAVAAGGVGGDDEPLDLGKPLRAEVLQAAEVLFHPGRLRRAALAGEDPQVMFPRLDQRMVTVLQQRELRNCARGETLRRLGIDHPLDAVCRRRLHICLLI